MFFTGKKLNDPADREDANDPELYTFGLFPLHAYIRCMELLLKVSYRLGMQKPAWRVSRLNESVKEREQSIKTAFREQLGLRISEPTPSGGNSNDGNTARRFFKDGKIVAQITGFDERLLERFSIILSVINSRLEINIEAFQEYAEETRQLYVHLYGWYPLSPTAHKLLVHGSTILKHAILPIGMLSEEAQESRNKSIRKFRENHARKFNRLTNIEDIFKRLMITSDPVIFFKLPDKKCSTLDLPDNTQHLIV